MHRYCVYNLQEAILPQKVLDGGKFQIPSRSTLRCSPTFLSRLGHSRGFTQRPVLLGTALQLSRASCSEHGGFYLRFQINFLGRCEHDRLWHGCSRGPRPRRGHHQPQVDRVWRHRQEDLSLRVAGMTSPSWSSSPSTILSIFLCKTNFFQWLVVFDNDNAPTLLDLNTASQF